MPALGNPLRTRLADVLRELHGESAGYVSSDIPFVSSNTQARRLGCCLFLVGKIINGTRTESSLESISETEIDEIEQNLRSNGYTSGFLTGARWSVRHYVDLLIDLKLLVTQGAVYLPTGRAEFLFHANRIDWRAPYPMSATVRRFWFKQIFENDLLGMTALMRLLDRDKINTIREIIRQFPGVLRGVLEDLGKLTKSSKARLEIRSKLAEIARWKSPEKYAEHLVAPRVNWLIDLGVLQVTKKDTYAVPFHYRSIVENIATEIQMTPVRLDLLCLEYAVGDGLESTLVATPSVLDEAFALGKPQHGLIKIRLSDLITFLVCNHPRTIVALAEQRISLMASLASDTRYNYQLYASPRQTQAYLYRNPA